MLSMFFVGCSKLGSKTTPSNSISQSDLFEGDTKDLATILGIVSSCVNVQYHGPKNHLQTNYEIWENGSIKYNKIKSCSSISHGFDGKISSALINKSSDDNKQVYKLYIGKKGDYSTVTISDVPNLTYIPLNINHEITISDDQEIAICGYAAYENDFDRTNKSIEECAKGAKWAIILKIMFSNNSAQSKILGIEQ